MPADEIKPVGQKMTAAERKRRQRQRQALGTEVATAESIDAALLKGLRNQARYMASGFAMRDPTVRELFIQVVNEFPLEERDKVWRRIGWRPSQ